METQVLRERIGLDFFAKAFYISHLRIRDGVRYCIGKRALLDRNEYESDLYRLDAQGGAVRLTGSGDVTDYALEEAGILFASTRNTKDQEAKKNGRPLTVFYRLPYQGGEAQEHLRVPYAVEEVRWLSSGMALLRAQYDHTLERFLVEYDGDMERALKEMREQAEALTCVDELPFWFNGQGFINKKRTLLYLYDGANFHRLTDVYANVDRLVLDDEGKRALFTMQTYQDMRPEETQLWRLDIQSRSVEMVKGLPGGEIDDYAFGPGGDILCVLIATDNPHGTMSGNPRLWRLPAGQAPVQLDQSGGLYNYGNGVGSDAKLGDAHGGLFVRDGKAYFLSTILSDTQLMACDLKSGEITPVTRTPGLITEAIPDGDGFCILAMRGNDLVDAYQVAPDGRETRLSDVNRALMDAHEIVTPIPLSFENAQGTEIHGWVMPPVGYVPGMVYPAILNIHGGPKTAYGSVFFHEMQYWCAQGYAVLFCNPTGGDGRGEQFADIRGRYGSVDYEDIMAFVDRAQAQYGFISAVRIGVTGGSYGGFMTNWIIGHTDRFQAAASQRSIANWLGFNNTSDIGYNFGRDQMQATPWSDEKAMWDMSPLKYADRAKTPTLFIHSEEDYRCNMFEGIQMFYALRVHGVDTRLCLFKGENHELSRSGKPKNRIRRLKEITRWMDRYLKS